MRRLLDVLWLRLRLARRERVAQVNAVEIRVVDVDDVRRHLIDDLAEDAVAREVLLHHLVPLVVGEFHLFDVKRKKKAQLDKRLK